MFADYEWFVYFSIASIFILLYKWSKDRVLWSALFMGLLLAYSIVSYKTPWLVLNILFPACMVLGMAIEAMSNSLVAKNKKWIVSIPVGGLLLSSFTLSVQLSFVNENKINSESYLYTHTHVSQSTMLKALEGVTSKDKSKYSMPIKISTGQTWPMRGP